MGSVTSLVTGGCGFIGSHLVGQLLERGDEVRILDLVESPGRPPDAELIIGSVLDADRVRRCMRRVDRVFHLAANPFLWDREPGAIERTNVLGTKVVLECARRAGVSRVVHTSTESILKRRRSPASAIDETRADLPLELPGEYCRSKFLAEEAALAAAGQGAPVVVVNPTLPVGPGDFRLTPPSRMLLMFLNGGVPAYLDCELNLIDVRDVARGHLQAAERGEAGARYILGNENLRLSWLLSYLEELTGLSMPRQRIAYPVAYLTAVLSEVIANHVTHRPPIAPLAGVRLARLSGRFDSSKAVAELGLPQSPVRRALADAVAWFMSRHLLRRRPMMTHALESAAV